MMHANTFQNALHGGLLRFGKHVYAGTVGEATIAKRRAASKQARKSRRINRRRAR